MQSNLMLWVKRLFVLEVFPFVVISVGVVTQKKVIIITILLTLLLLFSVK